MLYEIAVKTPLRRLFTYESDEELVAGSRVRVPFRNKEKIGFVWGESESRPKGLKKVSQTFEEDPIFNADCLRFYESAAAYYGVSVGELLSYSVPKKIRDGKEIPTAKPKDFHPALVELSEAQAAVKKQIQSTPEFFVHLVMGETGSGKTELYLHLLWEALSKGGQVLFLVPEISLTPQMRQRLNGRVGGKISVFHSDLKESERLQAFVQAYSSHSDLFLGARSALFLPYRNLKMIVIDEEHDNSYKQSERATYNARDLAILRAKQLNIPVVLGSATPSVESFSRAESKDKSMLYRLPKHFEGEPTQIEVIDLKETWKSEEKSFISNRLNEAISENLHNKEQSLLFLNRRGSASQRICTDCGKIEECVQCSSKLTLHFDLGRAVCHICGFQRLIEKECSDCGSKDFFMGGIGTKEVEAQIKERFPEARIARLDRDVTQKRNALGETLERFAEGEIDILVGTQMVSKGIDISKLSLVGIILADQGWSVPDFRAMERSYQLIQQIIGRVGRRGQKSRCLIQTFSPDHPVLTTLEQRTPYEEFLKSEMNLRESMGIPPFGRYILWTLSDRLEARLKENADVFVKRIQGLAKTLGIQLIGPVAAPMARIKNEYRYQVMARAAPNAKMTSFLTSVQDDLENRPLKVKVKIDRDPYQFM